MQKFQYSIYVIDIHLNKEYSQRRLYKCGWVGKINIYCVYMNPTPLHKQDVTQGEFLTGLNSELSFSYTGYYVKFKELFTL